MYAETLFSSEGITALDFIVVATTFVMAMATFFGLRNRKHWLKYFFVALLFLQCINALIFKPLPTKIFVTLMLMSTIIIETVLSRKWKPRAAGTRAG